MDRRCDSDSGISQSRHSRRIVPMTRSQVALAFGEHGGDFNTLIPSRGTLFEVFEGGSRFRFPYAVEGKGTGTDQKQREPRYKASFMPRLELTRLC